MKSTSIATDGRTSPRPVPARPLAAVRDFFDLDGATGRPLAILFALNLVDELDRIAFTTLTPEIRDAFGMTDTQIVAVGSISALLVLFAALPVGYLADRVSRVRMAQVAAILWGSMTVLTPFAWAVPVLFAVRFLSGIARSSNEIVHTGLLADYYSPRIHPKVYQIHRLAGSVGLSASLVAGWFGAWVGWRNTFLLLAIPTILTLVASFTLSEPERGGSIELAAASRRTRERSAGVRATVLRLYRVRSLRRLCVGALMIGASTLAMAQMLSLFYENVYGFGPSGRGAVQFAQGAGSVIGILIGGAVGVRLTRREGWDALMRLLAGAFFLAAVALSLMAVAPWWPASSFFTFLTGVATGIFVPVFFSLLVRVLPAFVRAQGHSYVLLAAAVGGIAAIPLARLGEHVGYRPTFVLLGLIIGAGSAVLLSAAKYVNDDVRRADAELAAGG